MYIPATTDERIRTYAGAARTGCIISDLKENTARLRRLRSADRCHRNPIPVYTEPSRRSGNTCAVYLRGTGDQDRKELRIGGGLRTAALVTSKEFSSKNKKSRFAESPSKTLEGAIRSSISDTARAAENSAERIDNTEGTAIRSVEFPRPRYTTANLDGRSKGRYYKGSTEGVTALAVWLPRAALARSAVDPYRSWTVFPGRAHNISRNTWTSSTDGKGF